MQFQARIQITMCAHTLKTKKRAHIVVGMRRVGMRSKDKNKEEMRQMVQGVWDQVSLEQLQRLMSSMPNRMQQIISTKGGSTRW
jgi:selenocysteine-specific translation elongation factor